MRIEYVNMQTMNGTPYAYTVGARTNGERGLDTHYFCRRVGVDAEIITEGEVSTEFYPISRLPRAVREFINSPDTNMSWWGSAGDASMYRFTRR